MWLYWCMSRIYAPFSLSTSPIDTSRVLWIGDDIFGAESREPEKGVVGAEPKLLDESELLSSGEEI